MVEKEVGKLTSLKNVDSKPFYIVQCLRERLKFEFFPNLFFTTILIILYGFQLP